MKLLNIQERKLKLIEQLIILTDVDIFEQVEALINSSFKGPNLKRLTKKELENRARISDEHIENGQVYSQDEVEKMSENW